VEGRALNREPRQQWAWLVPWFSGGVGSLIGYATGAERASAFVVGIAAGAAWQLLYRRDLTSRLTFMAAVVTIGVIATLAAHGEFVSEDAETAGLYATGILIGLIYTEHYQRWQDRATRSALRQSLDSDAEAH
jgi:Na+-translocating ferredoxin:NAD+ oxidoreductase RnfA subunit